MPTIFWLSKDRRERRFIDNVAAARAQKLQHRGTGAVTFHNQRQMIGIEEPFERDTKALHGSVRGNPVRDSQCATVLRHSSRLRCGHATSGF